MTKPVIATLLLHDTSTTTEVGAVAGTDTIVNLHIAVRGDGVVAEVKSETGIGIGIGTNIAIAHAKAVKSLGQSNVRVLG